jgi:peptidyl-prolyl cis-trans isomerase SurA
MKQFSTRCLKTTLALITALHLLSFSATAARRTIDRSVVTVNDEVILESDIKAFQEKLKSSGFRDLFGGLDGKIVNDRRALLQLMIEEKIIDQQVKKLDLTASDMEIDRQIRVIAEKNGIAEPQLKAQLKRLGTDFKDYRDGIKRQIERRNLLDREIRPTLEVSDEQVKAYYQRTHTKKSGAQTRYHIAHIFVQGTGAPSKARIEKIYEELKRDPTKFATLVAEYSDDSSSSENGGDLGTLPLDSLSTVFRASVPQTTPGKFTAPLKGKEGFHIVKVLATGSSGFEDLSREEKLQLRNEMAASEMEKKMTMWLERKKSDSHLKFAKEI